MCQIDSDCGCVCNALFRHVEQSNLLMEQRSDSLQTSSQQSHTRLLEAEKDKVCAHWSLVTSHDLAVTVALFKRARRCCLLV